jgi:tRNA dimethylallyltransferase
LPKSERGRLPIVVGGTGFYLRALEGLPVLPGRDEPCAGACCSGSGFVRGLHRLLTRLEPGAAARIHANDVQKTMRALEVRLLTKQALPPPGEARALEGYAVIKLGLDPDRAALQQRLEDRTRAMFAHGVLEEVRGLLAVGATGNEKPFEALGYKQALLHLRGALNLEQAMESTIVETRQYAKRQRTWFRRDRKFTGLALATTGDHRPVTQPDINALRGGLETRVETSRHGATRRPGAPHPSKRESMRERRSSMRAFTSPMREFTPQTRIIDQIPISTVSIVGTEASGSTIFALIDSMLPLQR